MLHCSAFLVDGARALTTFNFSCLSVLHHYLLLHASSSVEDTKSIKLICMRKAPEPTKKDRLSIFLGDIQIHTEHFCICSQSSEVGQFILLHVYFVSHGAAWLEFIWTAVSVLSSLTLEQTFYIHTFVIDISTSKCLDPTFALSKALILRLKMYTC